MLTTPESVFNKHVPSTGLTIKSQKEDHKNMKLQSVNLETM